MHSKSVTNYQGKNGLRKRTPKRTSNAINLEDYSIKTRKTQKFLTIQKFGGGNPWIEPEGSLDQILETVSEPTFKEESHDQKTFETSQRLTFSQLMTLKEHQMDAKSNYSRTMLQICNIKDKLQ